MMNLALATDFYELTMAQGYYLTGKHERRVVFDVFYRKNPFGNGYALFAGLERVIEYIDNLRFGDGEIEYLRGQGCFREEFLDYLRGFRFTGDIYAVPEGTAVFPTEPFLRVTAPIIEAQIIETAILAIVNHQTLIATKAARVVQAADGDGVLEFGLRRAQGPESGIYGARAAVLAGCVGTSATLAGQMFGIPAKGTHAHSWVMSFPDELTAFREYAKLYPYACTLLVDTYNVIANGVPNAIKVFREMKDAGVPTTNIGIRIDSGDLAYLTKKARHMLDEAGFPEAVISASGDLDEYLIESLKRQGAKATLWGVGTRLITGEGDPALGGVYKMSAQEGEGGKMIPTIKLSENAEKMTIPGVKTVWRLYDKTTGKARADLITLADEHIDTSRDLTIFHPVDTWKTMTFSAKAFTARNLLVPIFKDGERVYETPEFGDMKRYCRKEKDALWEEYRRLVNPAIYPVDLSQNLWFLRGEMIDKIRKAR